MLLSLIQDVPIDLAFGNKLRTLIRLRKFFNFIKLLQFEKIYVILQSET